MNLSSLVHKKIIEKRLRRLNGFHPQKIALEMPGSIERDMDHLLSIVSSNIRNSRIELSDGMNWFKINGPSKKYYLLDQNLKRNCLEQFGFDSDFDLQLFSQRIGKFDFCLEDSWSYFHIKKQDDGALEPITLLHFDAHSDMMPTLVGFDGDHYKNIPLDTKFDFLSLNSVEDAIMSGAIGIGSFITPLFHQWDNLTVHHVMPFGKREIRSFDVTPNLIENQILKDVRQLALTVRECDSAPTKLKYTVRSGIDQINEIAVEGRLIVHFDLDYFFNDFDGGSPNDRTQRHSELSESDYLSHVDDILKQIEGIGHKVDQWIVATSPGFCASDRWSKVIPRIFEI